MGIELIAAAFFGFCFILGVAPHVKYEKPGTTVTTTQTLSVGQAIDADTGKRLK